jgi:hypothetical protein
MNPPLTAYWDRLLLLCYHNPMLAIFMFVLICELVILAVLKPASMFLKWRGAYRPNFKNKGENSDAKTS